MFRLISIQSIEKLCLMKDVSNDFQFVFIFFFRLSNFVKIERFDSLKKEQGRGKLDETRKKKIKKWLSDGEASHLKMQIEK